MVISNIYELYMLPTRAPTPCTFLMRTLIRVEIALIFLVVIQNNAAILQGFRKRYIIIQSDVCILTFCIYSSFYNGSNHHVVTCADIICRRKNNLYFIYFGVCFKISSYGLLYLRFLNNENQSDIKANGMEMFCVNTVKV